MIGKTFGHYEITGKLGAGGMGVVYRARDTRLGREVALKALPAAEEQDAAARERLLEEARTASALNHPHVCTIYEVGEAEGVAYATMELVEGRSLGAQIPAEGLPIELVLRYGAQIADALAHAHERGVIHRDLKTANVMITPDGRAKVLDFGLARRVGANELNQATRSKMSLAEAGRVAGTLHYLAPETLRGAPADARSDIWALGAVLYEMAAGRLPYDGKSGYEVSSAILRDPLPTLPPRVLAGLRAVIQRCLAKEAGQRYQRAGEIRAALEAISSSDAAIAHVTDGQSVVEIQRKPWWRRKLVWGGAAVAAILALGFWKGPLLISIGRTPMSAGGPRTSTGVPASGISEANENFERGMLFLTMQFDLARAQQMFQRAVDLDPKFAEARGWLGFSHLLQIDSGYSNDTGWLYKAEEETRRALELNPRSIRARTTLAQIHLYRGRMEAMKPELEHVLAEDPSFFDAKVWLGSYYYLNGEYQQVKELLQPLLEEDPLLFPARAGLAEALREQGETAAAIREYEKIFEQDPQNIHHVGLARTHLHLGNTAAAREAMGRVKAADRSNFVVRIVWAVLLAKEGQRAKAQREMDEEVLKYAALVPFLTAVASEYYALMGERDMAVEWLDRAVRNGDERLEWFQRDPLLAGIREHPRFKQILESIAFQRKQRQSQARR
jgi:tetratricopeptide (TPR) repeat protein